MRNKLTEYGRGYESALKAIKRGDNPQELLNQSGGSLTIDDFDRGWKTACKESISQQEEPKQEPLEEAAERLYPTTIDSFTDTGIDMSEGDRLIFIAGVKWQEERMYSEEEIIIILDSYQVECQLKYSTGTIPDAREWLEQFKKK